SSPAYAPPVRTEPQPAPAMTSAPAYVPPMRSEPQPAATVKSAAPVWSEPQPAATVKSAAAYVAPVRSDLKPIASSMPAKEGVVQVNHQVMAASDAGSPYAIMSNMPTAPTSVPVAPMVMPAKPSVTPTMVNVAPAATVVSISSPVVVPVKTEPVPFDDLIGPKGRTVMQGQPIMEKASAPAAVVTAPTVATSTPAAQPMAV